MADETESLVAARCRLALLAMVFLPMNAQASDVLPAWQWISLVAMVTSIFMMPLYALSAAVFVRLIRRGKLRSTRLAHLVPLSVVTGYVLIRLLAGSFEDGVVVVGVFVGWACASVPYTLLIQWFWQKTQG